MKAVLAPMQFLAFILLLITIGCSSGKDPIVTGERTSQIFNENDILHIFGMELAEDGPLGGESPMDPCHDIDSAVLIDLADQDPAGVAGHTWSVFVTLERTGDDTFIPRFRWVTAGGQLTWQASSAVGSVPQNMQPCYRVPKCDAISYIDNNETVVELAVAYEVWDDTGNGDWDIGVTFLTWPENNFPHGDPTRTDRYFDFDAADTDDRWPDIAYDHFSGDLYLVYATYTSDNPESFVELNYWRYNHSGGDWNGEYYVDSGYVWSCLMPRIDVGLMDELYGAETWDQMTVGIVYTAQYCDIFTGEQQLGYHPHLFYWNANQDDGDKDDMFGDHPQVNRICLRNPVGTDDDPFHPGDYANPAPSTWFNNAGLPYIDIGPDSNPQNVGGIIFVQIVGTDFYGPVAEVWEVNIHNTVFASISSQVAQVNWEDALYPSMAIHYTNFGVTNRASLTYLRQQTRD